MELTKFSCLNTIMQQHYSNIYELDFEKQTIAEYSVSTMAQLEATTYEEWLQQIITQLQFIQIRTFTEQTQMKKILQELEENSCYVVEYQSNKGDHAKNYQMVFCYTDAEKTDHHYEVGYYKAQEKAA